MTLWNPSEGGIYKREQSTAANVADDGSAKMRTEKEHLALESGGPRLAWIRVVSRSVEDEKQSGVDSREQERRGRGRSVHGHQL